LLGVFGDMGQFFKQTMASLVGTLAGLLIFLGIGAGSLAILVFALANQDSTPPIEDKSFLVFDLATQITDSEKPVTLQQVLSGEETSSLTLRQVLQAIEQAAQDDRIQGIFLDGRKAGISSGYATLTEIRDALKKFKATGKQILAYDNDLAESGYYLTSIADKILLNPMGSLQVNGLASQQTFFAQAFKKYGIGVQVVRVGSFKAAVEPFIRSDFSPENQEQLQALLADIWNIYLAKIADSRGLTTAQLQAIANDQGIITAENAKKEKLIDQTAYFDQVLDDLKKSTDNESEKTFRQVALSRYVENLKNKSSSSSAPKLAIIYADGTIVDGQGALQQVGGESFSKEMRKIRQNKDIKAVVLRINSPGGSATASDIILREVQLTQAQKPVIVSMGNVAASGGYWIATGGSRIFAEPNTLTGSIGVFGLLINLQEISKNIGLNFDTVKTAQFADISSPIRPRTPQELEIYQKSVNQVYDLFLDKVAQSRKLPKDKVAAIAQGRVWSGEKAQKLGLVDEIGGLTQAIDYALKSANLTDKDWNLVEYPETQTLETILLEKLLNTKINAQVTAPDPLTVEWLKLKQELSLIEALNDPRGIYARMNLNFKGN